MRNWSGNRIPMYRVTACRGDATGALAGSAHPAAKAIRGLELMTVVFAG
jgi:hypothetical protein